MDFHFLIFLKDTTFFFAWFGSGALLALWFVYDLKAAKSRLPKAMKLAWPIIMVFFSVIALMLYLWVCRSKEPGQEASPAKRTINAAIHCVAGDGLGIMTAMVVSRLLFLGFWREFWFEYAVGFASGWFIFQYLSMRPMSKSFWEAIGKAGRAEFFSMITVMTGMGLVMKFITPAVVGRPPLPDTAAFWDFGALGLLVGFIFTYPMNYWMVRIGWKHGKCEKMK